MQAKPYSSPTTIAGRAPRYRSWLQSLQPKPETVANKPASLREQVATLAGLNGFILLAWLCVLFFPQTEFTRQQILQGWYFPVALTAVLNFMAGGYWVRVIAWPFRCPTKN